MACQKNSTEKTTAPAIQSMPLEQAHDAHSYSNPEQVRVEHLHLNCEVQFERKVLKCEARLAIKQADPTGKHPLILDTRDLKILSATAVSTEKNEPLKFSLSQPDKILGAALTIEIPPYATNATIQYETSPTASGVQWLDPAQTAGKQHPYVFTQSQAIHARSWIPLQDSPGARLTYTATIRTPKELRAVMSAEEEPQAPGSGEYKFRMDHPIPPYLIALAAGNIAFKSLGARTGVYTEPEVLEKAASELADTEKMVETTEKLYGPYRWGRYDILVLPPSFPYGGMENPRLTFATPTILAGDKSLVSLIAHELAHSWSGNLVTNATWRDFWLNEGFTTYLERRIVEAVYGRANEEMQAVLGRQTLEGLLAKYQPRDQILHIDLTGLDPDDGSTEVPYEKGALFLRQLEETVGREKFDQFLKGYFDSFAFQSITTGDFRAYLQKNLLDANPQLAAQVPSSLIDEWIEKPGLPASAPKPQSDAFAKVEEQAKAWLDGKVAAATLPGKQWTTQEWLHFLKFLPQGLSEKRMKELDDTFGLTKSGNAEIAHIWLLTAIRNKYTPAYPRLEEYLTSIGRQKLIKPLYEELMKTPEGKQRAKAIFAKARAGYHPIAQTSVGKIVNG
ncbi:MAG: M1 family metallopeptidase [Acidobacteriota bacterium]|nr:M1 family metallopeptidase [Acidobacteriota bacterium]